MHRAAVLASLVLLACAHREHEGTRPPREHATPMLSLADARRLPPVDLSRARPWRQTLASSNESFCHVREGRAECWGAAYGPRPRRIADIDDALEVSMMADGACAFRRSERLTCWSAHEAGGAEGPLDPSSRDHPVPGAIDWEEDDDVGCAIDATGGLRCFDLCHGEQCYRRFTPLPWSAQDVAVVAPSEQCPCVLTRAGALVCWGDNCKAWSGIDDAHPHVVEGLSGRMLFRGFFELCVARGDDRLLCRGAHLMDPAGSRPTDIAQIALPPGLSPPVRAVRFTDWECLVHAAGELSCRHFWEPFERVSDVPGRVRQVAGQIAWSVCVELEGGEVACRGDGSHGQLGNGASGAGAHSETWVTVPPAPPSP